MNLERGAQLKKTIAAMSRYEDLVVEAYGGALGASGDKGRLVALDNLAKAGVFKLAGPDDYILHPRLREFFSDSLQSFQAFQALRSVDQTYQQASAQWQELQRLHLHGMTEDALTLKFALEDSINEIAYSFDQNTELLHALLNTHFGNVGNLASKLAQNKYYARQIRRVLQDIETAGALATMIEEQALAIGMVDVRLRIQRRITTRLTQWSMRIKDAQTVISKRLFEAKQLKKNEMLLASAALFLQRNKAVDGFDPPVTEKVPPALLTPVRVNIRPQVDVHCNRAGAQDALLSVIAKLPPAVLPGAGAKEEEEDAHLMVADEGPIEVFLPQEYAAVLGFAQLVREDNEGQSLTDFKTRVQELERFTLRSWLMYAYGQLSNDKSLHFEFLRDEQSQDMTINETFYDIVVTSSHSPAKGVDV